MFYVQTNSPRRANVIGGIDASRVARIRDAGGEEAVVWDFVASPLIGCGRSEAAP